MQKKNAHLQETLAKMEQEHQLAITKLQQTHDERIAKMREHYVDFTHSILTLKDSTPGSSSTSEAVVAIRAVLPPAIAAVEGVQGLVEAVDLRVVAVALPNQSTLIIGVDVIL